MKDTTTANIIYVVVNHNNRARFVTDNVDEANMCACTWNAYDMGDAAVSIYTMTKTEYAKNCAYQMLKYTADTIGNNALFGDDLPF